MFILCWPRRVDRSRHLRLKAFHRTGWGLRSQTGRRRRHHQNRFADTVSSTRNVDASALLFGRRQRQHRHPQRPEPVFCTEGMDK